MSNPFFEMLAADDPSPFLHALRASDPVHLVEPLGFWLVTRHDDVKRLYSDPDNVTNDKRSARWSSTPRRLCAGDTAR